MFLAADPILPAWVVLPMAGFTLVVIGFHLQWMHRAKMPESRRRIRTASNLVSMGAVPLIAVGFGLINPDDHRLFVLVWLAIVGLLGIIVLLAMVDVLNNFRIHAAERRQIRGQIRGLEHELRAIMSERQGNG